MAKKKNIEPTGFNFINIGTRILQKDIMDGYIRSLGPHRTHYAANMGMIARVFADTRVDFVFLEHELPDANAVRIVRNIRDHWGGEGSYIVLAVEEELPELRHLADEIWADDVMVRPFNANDIRSIVENFEIRRKDPDDVSSILRSARAAYIKKLFVDGEKLFLEALKRAPERPDVQTHLGDHFLRKPDYVHSENHYGEAIKLNPDYVPAHHGMGQLMFRKKEYKKAFFHLTKAHQLSPRNPERAALLTRLYINWASSQLQSALRFDPKNPELHYELGRILIAHGEFNRAIDELNQAEFETGDDRNKKVEQLYEMLGYWKDSMAEDAG